MSEESSNNSNVNDTAMKVISESNYVMADGTQIKMTISIPESSELSDLSDEDRAMINRYVPLAGGLIIDTVEDMHRGVK